MTDSYLIKLEGNTLKVGRNLKLDVPGDRLIEDARSQLQALISSAQLTGGSLLKIDGMSSLAIGYLLAHELGHLYKVIAVCDPRLQVKLLNRYVVVISYAEEYDIGDVIECSDTEAKKVAKVIPKSKDDSTFFASVEGNILKVGCIRAEGNQIAVDAAARIDELIAEGKLKGGKLLRVNGKATLLTSYVLAHRLGHLYSAIAVFDPKICDMGRDRYIVALSHGSNSAIGSILEYSVPKKLTAKVAICGFPGAGKTCLREGLKYAIENISAIPNDFCYVISACPDGDTAYFSQTAQQDLELANKLRQRNKKGYTDKFADSKAIEIKSIQNNLLLFDVGGKITTHNWTIMSEATHAVVLARKEENEQNNVRRWQEFCQDLNLRVVAIIYSDYYGTSDTIVQQASVISRENAEVSPLQNDKNILIGTVHHLDRQADASSRPTVKELANLSFCERRPTLIGASQKR